MYCHGRRQPELELSYTKLITLYTSLFESYCFEICTQEVTREAAKTRIDHVWSNMTQERSHIVLICPMKDDNVIKTDHSLILTRIVIELEKTTESYVKTREKLNHKRIENQFEYRFHDSILSLFDDCDKLAEYIVTSIHRTIDENKIQIRVRRSKEDM